MPPSQIVFGSLLILLLFFASGWFARRQIRSLRQIKKNAHSPEEERFHRRQAWRRLICSSLMAILGLLLIAAMVFLETPAQRLADLKPDVLNPEQKAFARFYAWFWIVFLVILFSILLLAGLDFMATRRFARRQYERIRSQRRTAIEEGVAQIRAQQRNVE